MSAARAARPRAAAASPPSVHAPVPGAAPANAPLVAPAPGAVPANPPAPAKTPRAALRALTGALLLAACAPGPRPATTGAGPRPSPDEERFVSALVGKMTLEEKIGQLTQSPAWGGADVPMNDSVAAEVRAGRVGSFLGIPWPQRQRELQRTVMEESRLKIPLMFAHDVIHGFRTIFPVPLAEAASWDPDMVQRDARIAADEATASGIHWTFAPMVDIARDPRWGRIVEGSGEDPFLGSVMAAARVRGFQGPGLGTDSTMMATAKHFVAYGAAEGGRDYNTADISERTLREVYLPPFHAAVRAGVASVMPSFNEIAGVPMHANAGLIDGVLRREWGWDGIVVSDWGGVQELIAHGVATGPEHAAMLGILSGVDVDMASGTYRAGLPDAVRSGRVPMAVVDQSVRRVLRAKYRLGLFRDPFRYLDPDREDRRARPTPAHRAAARQAARQSIVLLKNDGGTLPLAKDVGTLAVIGALATDARSALGSWAAVGRESETVTVLDGIREAVSRRTRVLAADGVPLDKDDDSGIPEAVRVARRADAVVLVLGETAEMSGEAHSRSTLDLPGRQLELARAVVATGRPVVVVLMNGRPLAIPWLAANVPAILETWFLGTETGHAVADVLFGDYNPTGKLPITFPRAVGQVPIYYAHKNTGRPPVDAERYTSKYLDLPSTPLYPFGYGLSYTAFAYDSVRVGAERIGPTDSVVVSVDVRNRGDRPGRELVQLYIQDEVASVTRPVKELRGFRRTGVLLPDQRERVAFTLHPDDLAFTDAAGRRVVEPGFFKVFLGGSSADVRQARFEVVAAAAGTTKKK
ncbi:MAG TPA: glycoside hydrolase family 3 N-terminal domain-containing protein [Longimicrobiales bacterium]|nr:glycoside hydrolase family 3 N-terminal domain-containing protein [Longimicrobiales bacterium]